MYNNLDYSSLGLGPETNHSPQGQGREAPLTPVRVTPHHSVLQILEFCDATELIVANTCFRRQKNKLATYVSGGTVSATDYMPLRCDRRIIKKTSKSLLEKSVYHSIGYLLVMLSLVVHQER